MYSSVRRHCESIVLCPKMQHNEIAWSGCAILTIKLLPLAPPSHRKILLGYFCVSVIFFLGLSFMLVIKTIYCFSSSVVTLKVSLLQNSTKIITFHTFIFFLETTFLHRNIWRRDRDVHSWQLNGPLPCCPSRYLSIWYYCFHGN